MVNKRVGIIRVTLVASVHNKSYAPVIRRVSSKLRLTSAICVTN